MKCKKCGSGEYTYGECYGNVCPPCHWEGIKKDGPVDMDDVIECLHCGIKLRYGASFGPGSKGGLCRRCHDILIDKFGSGYGLDSINNNREVGGKTMPIVLYKKTDDFDKWQEVEEELRKKAKQMVETSSIADMDRTVELIKKTRIAAGLDKDGRAGFKKVSTCFFTSTVDPERTLGFIQQMIDGRGYKKELKERAGHDFVDIFQPEDDIEYQYISWNIAKTKIDEAIECYEDWLSGEGGYETKVYRNDKYYNNTEKATQAVIDNDGKKTGNQMGAFFNGKKIRGVFAGGSNNEFIIVFEREDEDTILQILKNVDEMINKILSEKYPNDYVLRWEVK